MVANTGRVYTIGKGKRKENNINQRHIIIRLAAGVYLIYLLPIPSDLLPEFLKRSK